MKSKRWPPNDPREWIRRERREHLVRSLADLVDAGVAKHALQGPVREVGRSAQDREGVLDDRPQGLRFILADGCQERFRFRLPKGWHLRRQGMRPCRFSFSAVCIEIFK
jgi:hypothetical protein